MNEEYILRDTVTELFSGMGADVAMDLRATPSGLLAEVYLRTDNSSLVRLYLPRGGVNVYRVPSHVAGLADMDRLYADPRRRARLTLV